MRDVGWAVPTIGMLVGTAHPTELCEGSPGVSRRRSNPGHPSFDLNDHQLRTQYGIERP
jgi:hypothetical protein